MSDAGAAIARLLARGLSGEQIGRAIGRDRSLVSQVNRGVKPGHNLGPALAELEARLDAGRPAAGVSEPARRTTRSGRVARVRRPTTVGRGSWRTTKLGKQASGSGGSAVGRSILAAGEDGGEARATITFDKSVTVRAKYGKRGAVGAGGTVELGFDPESFDGTPGEAMAWLLDQAADAGFIDQGVTPDQVRAVELRVF